MRSPLKYPNRLKCSWGLALAALIAGLSSSHFTCAQNTQPKSDPYFRPDASSTESRAPNQQNNAGSAAPAATFAQTSHIDTSPPSDSNAKPFEAGQVIAIVGGEPIFFGDMAFEIHQILEKVMGTATREQKQNEVGNVVRVLTPRYIEQKLLVVYAKQQLPEGASWSSVVEQAEREFDEKMLPLLYEKFGAASQLALDGLFRVQGTSLRSFKQRWAEDQIARYFNMQAINLDPEITHQEMLDYYHAHLDDFTVKARVMWEELAVMFDRFPSRQAAFESIVEMGNEVVYGASFAAVAQKSSQGITAQNGGVHDWTARGSLVHANIEEALFTLPVDQLSDLIETKIGVHIIRVKQREEQRVIPFVEAQAKIKETLLEQKRVEQFERHTAKLRELYPVEVLVN